MYRNATKFNGTPNLLLPKPFPGYVSARLCIYACLSFRLVVVTVSVL